MNSRRIGCSIRKHSDHSSSTAIIIIFIIVIAMRDNHYHLQLHNNVVIVIGKNKHLLCFFSNNIVSSYYNNNNIQNKSYIIDLPSERMNERTNIYLNTKIEWLSETCRRHSILENPIESFQPQNIRNM